MVVLMSRWDRMREVTNLAVASVVRYFRIELMRPEELLVLVNDQSLQPLSLKAKRPLER